MIIVGIVLLLFVLTGFAGVSWLHRADHLDLSTRLVLGATWSFAVFSLVAGPFLWLQGKASAFLTVAAAVWVVFTLLSGLLFYRTYRSDKSAPDAAPSKQPNRAGKTRFSRPFTRFGVAVVCGLYLGLVGAALAAWANGPETRQWLTPCLAAVLCIGAAFAFVLQRLTEPLVVVARHGIKPVAKSLVEHNPWHPAFVWQRMTSTPLVFEPEDDACPPVLWSALAGLLILTQAVGVTAYGRPDWDDCFYLAAALDYQDGEILNDQEPTHREGFPSQAVYRFMTWELWGATIGRLSGVSPLVLFHSLLPGFLVLACYAAYRAVLLEIIPRRWVPLALIGLSAFHLWGMSNLGNASNHFLVRIWQGKALMLHLGIPLCALALLRFGRQPSWRWWATLCACLIVNLGLTSSSIFLCTIFLTCLAPLLIPTVPAGRRIVFVAGAVVALLPTVGVGLLVRASVRGDVAYQADAPPPSSQEWYREWDRYAGNGSAEIVWLATLPLLWVLLAGWRSRAILIGLPAVLFLSFGNPWLQSLVSSKLTGAVTYYRLFWLYPVGLGLSILLALLARFAGEMLSSGAGFLRNAVPLAVCACGLAVSAALPGFAVWSERNGLPPFMVPGPAENPEHMPAELKSIARKLLDEADLADQRIACGEEVASFLAPFSRRFRFVVTRVGYTMYSVGRENGPAEAAERLYLVDSLWRGRGFPPLQEAGWKLCVRTAGRDADASRPTPWPSYETTPVLVDRYHVGYAVSSPVIEQNDRLKRLILREREHSLLRNGFREIYHGESYSLWKRVGISSMPGRVSDAGEPATKPR